ncbi:MAG: response regulator [Nitrospirales bacterium]|nr:response regulator [Nitrospirales bacterium]
MLSEHSPTVLIVDDDSDMRLYCAKALQSEGYVTVSTSNASTALEVLGRQPVDLLLTDFQLGPSAFRLARGPRPKPLLTGVGLMQLALAAHPRLSVVFISAYGDQMLTTKGFDAGKQPLLRKPFQAESLRQVVRDTLEKGATPPTSEAMPVPALIPRAHPRFQVSHAVLFSGRVDGHGTVSNLSQNGCQIQSSCMVRPDNYLTLLLSLPDAPLKINVAVVRWNRPGVFGVEFRYVEGTIRERLAQYLSTLNPLR